MRLGRPSLPAAALRAGLIAGVTITAVAGCGGAEDGPAGPVPSPAVSTTAAPAPAPAPALADPAAGAAAQAAMNNYLDALTKRQAPRACALLSPRYAREQVRRAVTFDIVKRDATCVEFLRTVFAESTTPEPEQEGAAGIQVTALRASATSATVRVDYGAAGAEPDTYLLVRTAGRWLIDANG